MLIDLLFKIATPIVAVFLTFTTWREYRQLAGPNTRALIGLIAMTFFSILSIIGCILYLINPIKFQYNPSLFGWLLTYCTSFLTSPKYTMNPKRFRTAAAIGGIVLVIVGIIAGFMNI